MKIVRFSLNHPVTVFMAAVAALIFGFISYDKLPLNLLPQISYPTLTIKTEYPGTAPSEIENNVSKPIEESVGVVDNVVRVSSVSRAEVSEVTIEFSWNTNMDFATLKVREKIDLLNLPQGARKPIILRYDPNSEPIMKLGISGGAELSRIRYIAETELKQALESIEGVAACTISGGFEEEIQIDLDEQQISLLNISVAAIANRLAQENINLSAGILREKDSQFLVRTVNEFKSIDEIKEIIIENRNGIPIKLGQLARVYPGHKERKVISRINGQECVEAALFRAADANTVTVAEQIAVRLERIEKDILKPRQMNYVIITNQAKFIKSSIEEVKNTAVLGGIFAILVLLFFLKNIRSTLIIGVSIPLSVIITFFLMLNFDISLNIISLGGLALGIGMLVDNSIVVLEAIHRYREMGLDDREASLQGTSEVAGAITASTLTTVAVFFPIVFVEGIAGQLFRDMALTVTFSLLASLLVSLTLIPMLNSILRRSQQIKSGGGILHKVFYPLDQVYERGFSAYKRLQAFSFKRRSIFLLSALLLFLISIGAFSFLGKELIPAISQGEFIINVETRPGTALADNTRIVDSVYERLTKIPEIASVYEMIGKGSRGGISFQEEQENLSELIVRLQPGILGRAEEKVMEKARLALADLENLQLKIYRPRLFSFKAPLEIVISGNSLEHLKTVSDQLLAQMRDIPGLIDLKSSMEEGYPEIQIVFNRFLLSQQGLNIQTAGSQLRSKVEGDIATRFIESDREIDIRVRVGEDFRANLAAIERMTIRNGFGQTIPLKSVADIGISEGPAEIRRIGQQKSAVITSDLMGVDLESVTRKALELAASIDLPADVRIYAGGQSQEKDVAFSSMVFAILLAVFLVYLVMASQFESFHMPFIILFTIPLALIGVVFFNLLLGVTVNVIMLIGVIILAGIIVNNAIVLVDFTRKLQLKGMDKFSAVREAAQVRWRPILMTTLTTVLGLLPMALDFQEGFEIRIPIAVTLIGGLSFGTILTLVIIPLVYTLLTRNKLIRAEEESAE